MMISKLYEEYFGPYKEDYLFIGGLIIFLGFIQQIFKENIFKFFLLGASLFLVSCLFLGIFFKLWKKEIFEKKDAHILDSFFVIFYTISVLILFYLSYIEYTPIFNSFFGMGFGLILISAFSEIRRVSIIIRNKIKCNNLKLIFRIVTFMIFFILLFFCVYYSNIYISKNDSKLDSTSLNGEELFLMFASYFAKLGLFILILLSFIEIFKETKKNGNMNWENMMFYNSFQDIKTNFKRIWSYFFK